MTGRRRGMVAALAAATMLLGAGCTGSTAQGFASASRPDADDTQTSSRPRSDSGSASTSEQLPRTPRRTPSPTPTTTHRPGSAAAVLDGLDEVQPASRPAYRRDAFGQPPAQLGSGCTVRERVLARDLDDVSTDEDSCVVESGVLEADPYGGAQVWYQLGGGSPLRVDHVVALEDAWDSGAAAWSPQRRAAFASDPDNLIAVGLQGAQARDGANAAEWLPPNEKGRCRYVARQIAVKDTYDLAVTGTERARMREVLSDCPRQRAIQLRATPTSARPSTPGQAAQR